MEIKEFHKKSIEQLKQDYEAGKKVNRCANCNGLINDYDSFCDFNCIEEYLN